MIYIVEDDASIRELEQYALQTNQYTVRGFEDGASFWAAVRGLQLFQSLLRLLLYPLFPV